jgi:hypothetical protein
VIDHLVIWTFGSLLCVYQLREKVPDTYISAKLNPRTAYQSRSLRNCRRHHIFAFHSTMGHDGYEATVPVRLKFDHFR